MTRFMLAKDLVPGDVLWGGLSIVEIGPYLFRNMFGFGDVEGIEVTYAGSGLTGRRRFTNESEVLLWYGQGPGVPL